MGAKIYLAGKIGPDDWRHELVDGLRDVEPDLSKPWPVLSNAVLGCCDYVGPYFYSGDGGHDGHNDPAYYTEGGHGIIEIGMSGHSSRGNEEDRPIVVRQCLAAIYAADLVFAWIEDATCYGTIFELGYAVAHGKKIVVCGPAWNDDLWFALNACGKFITFISPRIALEKMLAIYGLDARTSRLESPIEKAFWREWNTTLFSALFQLEPQYEVEGGKYRLDFAYPPLKFAIELDGYEWHNSKEQFTKDRQRQRTLEASGWRFIRFSGQEIYQDARKHAIEAGKTLQQIYRASRPMNAE